MNHADLVRALELAGFPDNRRDEVAREIAHRMEVHQFAANEPPKPTETFKKIRATADDLLDLLKSIPDVWRLSLGTIINKEEGKKGEWSESIDWRPALRSLIDQADIMTRDKEGNPPKRGPPVDGKFLALLFDIVLLWERERKGVQGVQRNAWGEVPDGVQQMSIYKGPLLDLAFSVLTAYGIKFTSRYTLARDIEYFTKSA